MPESAPQVITPDDETEATATVARRGRARDRSQFSFFESSDMGELSDIMTDPEYPVEIIDKLDFGPLMVGHRTKLLFCNEGDDGFSLALIQFAPHFMLPRHTHNVDCLYYVLSGEALLGRRVVKAGSGFYVPAGHPYAYQAGAGGIELLEIRNATSFNMKVVEDNPARWQTMIDVARANERLWTEFSGAGAGD
jgi:mannose-6-phosphate isomerase-like protein (cupin superfamily)